jgi:hypothetical protein
MKGNVNPFEPWRPIEMKVPPPLHVGRPWRPPAPPARRVAVEEPPFLEPVERPRNKPPLRQPKPQPPRGQASGPPLRPAPQRSACPCRLGVLFLVSVVSAMALPLLVAGMKESHFARVSLADVSAAFGLAMSLVLYRRSWYSRLGWLAGGLALAGLAIWFMPTTHGVSLWSAYRQVEELRTLPAGDLAGYQRGAFARKQVVAEFPTFAVDVRAAEQAWMRRTADALIEKTDHQLGNDPQKALTDLHRANEELSGLEHYPLVKKDVEAARRRAVQACLNVAQK